MRDAVSSHPPAKLRQWRKHRNLSQEELAEKIGVEKVTISRWERGQRGLTLTTLESLAEALHCTVYDLLFRDPNEAVDLFKIYAELPRERREILEKMIRSLSDDDESEPSTVWQKPQS